jgi:hypothetical protein
MLRDTRRQLEFDTGVASSSSVGSRGSGSLSLQDQASAAAADLLARGGSLVPFGPGTLFHDYDPVQSDIDDILDDMADVGRSPTDRHAVSCATEIEGEDLT